ncbi:MoxR-like ATPase [Dictyobacter alpinus]|uniref:MoxR-like ATPase n=1 Tax=Dictyobacter alpinus TaxID=2014873 RepID=A0A402BH16_9CHLR|nr:AAA family ATPase [Dictyobacter alpinus]GCE30570.1 MoxR-like ATPase [Dictyobacter alpinus]
MTYPQRLVPPPQLTQPSPIEPVLFEVKRLIVGQDHLLERLLVALLARGHVLLEGVPGLAKTATVKALARVVGGNFGRVQFTPDLVPADLIGTRIYNAKNAEFVTELGPIFVHLLLADEINRAPAKVQSALLEVMQEHQVTIGKQTHFVPDPFLVLATQNPIESDGTYPLPEAQLDRFMFKVLVGYPSYEDEIVIVERVTGANIVLQTLLNPEGLRHFQQEVERVYVDPHVVLYAATLVHATREPARHGLARLHGALLYGASPRASINLVSGARALAFMRGRPYALPRDVADLVPDVLRHRMVLSYEAVADGLTTDMIVAELLQRFPPPHIDLGDRYVG